MSIGVFFKVPDKVILNSLGIVKVIKELRHFLKAEPGKGWRFSLPFI
jgi:hypothetical protein